MREQNYCNKTFHWGKELLHEWHLWCHTQCCGHTRCDCGLHVGCAVPWEEEWWNWGFFPPEFGSPIPQSSWWCQHAPGWCCTGKWSFSSPLSQLASGRQGAALTSAPGVCAELRLARESWDLLLSPCLQLAPRAGLAPAASPADHTSGTLGEREWFGSLGLAMFSTWHAQSTKK